ncbi:uncharacterized protein Dana_GF23814 [Drosophila ananassae]|uniref:Amino acid transporter transmembrane domain-containing protein n=2 Tax=Drosophila ananassae TaxID=7217 RepID=B3M5M3_DROAN|nr:glutamate transporter polyphemus isoform X1 [Drosophila ananassae]EDV40657.2 uncharacterized protein Dana_GF23814 [Drosophila ananassae]
MATSSYDPYAQRDVDKNISNIGAFATIVKSVVGTGLLALPMALQWSGIILGVMLLIGAMMLQTHGLQLLIVCMVECARRQNVAYVNYPDSVVFCFSQGPECMKHWPVIIARVVDFFISFSHYGVCVIYIVFVSLNIKHIMDQYVKAMDERYYIAGIGLILIPLFMIRHLRYLVCLSLLGNALTYFGSFLILGYLIKDLPELSDRKLFGEPVQFPLYLDIILFTMASVGVMLVIEAKMKSPETCIGCFGLINMAMLFILFTYITFGVLGYWKYGSEVAESVTLSLPPEEVLSQFIKLLFAFDILFSYPLSGYVVIDIIMNHYWNKNGDLGQPIIKEILLRIIFVLASTLTAVAFPMLGTLMAFVGVFCIPLINLVFPAVMDLCLLFPPEYSYGTLRWKLIKDWFLIIIGIVIFIPGSIAVLLSISKQMISG